MTFESQMLEFETLTAELNRKGLIEEHLSEHAFVLKGERPSWFPRDRSIGLLVLGLIHGDEVAGLASINRVLLSVLNGNSQPRFPLAMALGNVPAGYEGVRFIEKDLNRIFGKDDYATTEERRARLLETVMKKSLFVLDLHQTIEPSESPFFIFGFERKAVAFARLLSEDLPIVTYSLKDRAESGHVVTSYTIANGGIAVTAELGQKGFDPDQITLGVKLIDTAIAALNACSKSPSEDVEMVLAGQVAEDDSLMVYRHKFLNKDGSAELIDGLTNFFPVTKGQKVGTVNGQELLSPVDGKLLFPKYGRSRKGTQDLCVVIGTTSASEFLFDPEN